MSKIILIMLVAISFVSTSAFAEPSIEVNTSENEIMALDSILVTGTITDVSKYKPVKITITDPNGEIVYSPEVPIEEGGFKKLIQPTLPSFEEGTYTVTASHEDTDITAITQFVVIAEQIPRSQIIQDSIIPETSNTTKEITISADAIEGSDTITISGNTRVQGTDITLVVNSPNGNIVTIAQVTPGPQGNFEAEIKIGGSMWKEDGMYTITANQGVASEHKESISVEIKEGLVVPEFGVIATLILAVSIIAIIGLSARSRLSILPRY